MHAFTYPVQEHKLEAGDDVFDPATGKKAGKILELDDAVGRLTLVRGPSLEEVPLPRALIPGGPFDTKPQREALARLARSLLDGTRRYSALEGILARERPRAGRDVVADDRPRGDEAARARPRREPPRRPGAARARGRPGRARA